MPRPVHLKMAKVVNTVMCILSKLKKKKFSLASVAQLVGALSGKQKDHRFDSHSGHMPRLRVWSQSGHLGEATN